MDRAHSVGEPVIGARIEHGGDRDLERIGRSIMSEAEDPRLYSNIVNPQP